MSWDYGTSIRFPLRELERRQLDEVVSVIFEHYGSIEKVEKALSDGLSLRFADVTMTCNFSERSFDLPGFSFFAKAFTQTQLETVASLWKQFVHRSHEGDDEQRSEVDDGDDGDPLAELAGLGAIVYPPDCEWTFERLAGTTRTKREIEQTIVLPLVRPDVFAGRHRAHAGPAHDEPPSCGVVRGGSRNGQDDDGADRGKHERAGARLRACRGDRKQVVR